MLADVCTANGWLNVAARLFLAALLAAGSDCIAKDGRAKQVVIPNPSLENQGKGWWFEPGHGKYNRVEWITEDAGEGQTCAKLIYSGNEWLWLNTPPLDALEPEKEVTLAFQVKWLSGGHVFSVGCNLLYRADKRWGDVHDQLWVGELPSDSKWHEMEIKFRTPAFDFERCYACIKMGPRLEPATVLIDNVRILSVADPAPQVTGVEAFDASRAGPVQFDLPDEVSLANFPHVSQMMRDGKTWRQVNLRDVCVLAPAEVKVKMGFPESFRVVVENRASTKATVEILATDRLNVQVETGSVEAPANGRAEVRVGLQTVRAVEFDLVLKVHSAGLRSSLPVRVTPQVTYPMFGLVEHFMRCPPRERGSFLDPKTNAKAEADMTYMRLLPCQVFRVDGPGCWNVVEREKGAYFLDAADWHVDATRKLGGSKSVMLLGYEPGWAQPFFDPRENEKLDHWRNYVRALARRYRDKVDYWEIWNEPYGFWFGGPAKTKKKLYAKDYAEECSPILAEVIRTASEVIRQETPDGKILSPGFVAEAKKAGSDPYRMMEKLFQMGMGDWVDFINLHIYPLGFREVPLAPSGWKVDGKEVVSWEKTLKNWRQFDKEITIKDLQALMEKYGVKKPIWITEFGGHPATFERSQGLGILRQVAVLVSEGAKGLHYYEFYDYPHEPGRFQLVRHADKHRTLGLVAYSQAIRYLTGARHEPERCEVRRGEMDEDNLPCRVFGRGGETIVCLWSNCAKPAEIEIRTKNSFASAHVSTFSPDEQFLTQTSLVAAGKSSEGPTRIVSPQRVVTLLRPLQFTILSLR